jgi:cytochrome c
MKNHLHIAAVALFAAVSFAPSHAAERGATQEAVALAQKAVAYYKANGKDKAFAEINNKTGQFVDRDMYVFVFNIDGIMLAHGANERMIGKQVLQLKDADGKVFGQEMQALVKAAKPGWIDYKWPNSVTQKIEPKTTYVEPVGELGFAVGIYK